MKVSLHDFICTACKRRVAANVIVEKNGCCSCGGASFDFQVATETGGIDGKGLIKKAKVEWSTETRSYDFENVAGNLILLLLKFEPHAVLNWVNTVRKEQFKANLRPDQALCI